MMSAAAREPGTAVLSSQKSDTALPLLPPSLPPSSRAEPPWRLPGQPGELAGEATTAELGRISPKTVVIVEPPDPPARAFGAKGWFIGLALIAGGVGGYTLGYAPWDAPEGTSSVANSEHAIAEHAIAATGEVASGETAPARIPVPRLTVEAARLWRADEPAPLTISYADAGSNISVLIDGLAPGSTLWAGIPASPTAWRLASKDLNSAVIWPPHGFVGAMTLTLELRLVDDAVADRKSLRLEWHDGRDGAVGASAAPVQGHLDAPDLAVSMKRGDALEASGNIAADTRW
jgi:hypothetical protein